MKRKPSGRGRRAVRGVRLGAAARIVVGSALLIGVLFVAVFPTRTLLDQREAIASSKDRLTVLRQETARLRGEVKKLQTDAEIERIARERYTLARPGEEVFVLIPATPDGTQLTAARGAAYFRDPVLRLWGVGAPASPPAAPAASRH